MRNVRLRFLVGGIGAVVIAIVACGGSSDNGPGTTATADSGPDTNANVPDSNTPDTNVPDTNVPDTTPPPVVCVDASLTALSVPDASLDDAGATTGTCLACANTSCTSDITACQGDCACLDALVCVYQNCGTELGNTTSLAECAASASCISLSGGAAGIPTALLSLATCIQKSCGPQCGTPATPDSGTPDGESDAPHDAPTDG